MVFMRKFKITFDPLNVFGRELDKYELEEQSEDIFQAKNETDDIIIDLGWYKTTYRIYVIKGQDWREPIETVEFKDYDLIKLELTKVIDKYEK